MALFNNKKTNTKKKTAPADNRKNIPQQQRRPVSPSAAGRQAPPPQYKRLPPKTAADNTVKNAPAKNAPAKKPSKANARSEFLRNNRKPMPQNARTMSSAKAPAPRNAPSQNVSRPSGKTAPGIAQKPASKAAVKAPKRTKRTVQSKHKYHGGNYILYYMLAGVVIITVLAILANTVLFRCNTITVSGNTRYTSEEIAERSNIEMGKNLLHINVRQAEEKIVSSLAYIDAAKVKRSFPTGISITVTEAEKWFCIRQGNTTAAVSHAGKVIEHSPPGGLTVFTGYEPESVDIGIWLKSKTDGKTDIPGIIINAIEKASLENVDEVDLDDRFSIKMYIEGGRVTLELGTIADMESKLLIANKLILNKIAPSERVTVLLSNPEQATVVPEKISETVEPSEDTDNSDSSSAE